MMRKYLMTGLVAVALSGLFSSCSQEIETGVETTPEFNILQNYENAFITRFGQPAENQDWGFGEVAGTRTENANANEWADPTKAYGGLKVPPPLTSEQIAVVRKYFQTHPNLGYEDPGWSNYFIQQVYKGHTNVPEGCATSEQYLAANGSSYIIASDHMDHLIAVDTEKGIYDHINNFNHGDCSTNGSVLTWSPDYVSSANTGPFHSDKIMYMQNSTTKSFGYHNSDGSLYHTEYTGLVSYKTIMQAMGAEANCLDDGWNRSFMGFDFEQMVGSDILSGATFTFEGKTYNFLKAETNMYAADLSEESYKQKNGSTSTIGGKANFNNEPDAATKRDLLSKGYLPYSDTFKDWVKVGGTADGYFSDWIVTLTEAKGSYPPPPGFVCRIIAEDLTVGENSDFDFNDVVFDVINNGTTIRLRAAGGTLPLYVANQEVHAAFATKYQGITSTTMVNTGWGGSIDYYGYYVDIPSNGSYSTRALAVTIPVKVTKRGKDNELIDVDLMAERGKVASKVCVGSDYLWCRERQDIDAKYHKADGTKLFQQYVIGNLTSDWEHGNAWYQKLNQ